MKVMKIPNHFLFFVAVSLLHRAYTQKVNWGYTEHMLKYVFEIVKHSSEEPKDEIDILPEYDFIVVGAGSAGCVVANRLTEIPQWDVLLLEAGGEESYIMDIPALAMMLQFTDANWNYKGVPSNRTCLGLTNRQCLFPRGKIMGGSSVLNYMIHNRGNRKDYDLWENLGNVGWGYKDILPYFLRSEDIAIPELAKNTKYHSTGGYMTISFPSFHTPLAEAFLQAGVETGQQIVDYNGETQTGFSFIQTSTKNGTRWSTSRAFLHPVRNRKNLHVKKRAQVTKILIDPDTKRAYGVEFVRNKKPYVVRAKKEVILSAGAINSPQLLMLSGIGPKKHLEETKIPVIQDLKVGFNLMDHMAVIGITFLVNESASLRSDDVFQDGKDLIEYFRYHTGPLVTAGGVEGIAFYDTQNVTGPNGYPDVELIFVGGSIVSDPTLRKVFGISDYVYDTVYKPIEKAHAWMIIPTLLAPKSTGRIMLKDNKPLHKPLIFHNYLEYSDDLEVLLKGVKLSVQLSETKTFQKFGSKLHAIPVPGCERFEFRSDDYWRCVIKHMTCSMFHVSGTCKMGPASDRDAVVDPRLKVYGINGLRVIDSSVMPVVPRAHTNAPTIMIAEKGADLVKEDWGQLE
jgi:choline dehydrogenase-like flavoprotein